MLRTRMFRLAQASLGLDGPVLTTGCGGATANATGGAISAGAGSGNGAGAKAGTAGSFAVALRGFAGADAIKAAGAAMTTATEAGSAVPSASEPPPLGHESRCSSVAHNCAARFPCQAAKNSYLVVWMRPLEARDKAQRGNACAIAAPKTRAVSRTWRPRRQW